VPEGSLNQSACKKMKAKRMADENLVPNNSARSAAVRLIAGVTVDCAPLSDQISRGALAALAPADRARAQRLTLETLRLLGPIDAVLKPLLRREPPAFVRAVLRLALAELLGQGAAAHGVVNDAVAITRAAGRKTEGFTGMVNAVLRKAAATDPTAFQALPPQHLPGWLRGRLMSAWGKPATMAMEAAHARGAALDLTPKSGDTAALCAMLGQTAQALPTGGVRLSNPGQVSELPGFAAGDWWVQDAAAQLPARALRPRSGEAILDLCAAPGGKTLQLAAAGARVTSLDLSASRMERVAENLARCGLTAQMVVADALQWQPDGLFDAVLLDAPCSATGTIRRHPDLPFVKDASGLKEVFALQTALIDRAVGFLKPGGRLVFATCSLLPDEGERQLIGALARHASLALDPSALDLPGIEPDWITPEGGLRLRPDYWPDLGGMDGFFVAALRLRA
jgi:16S rRNA (cytosine967-C5)-methyltransferase